jgi:very-short-patch-repair endonuclease
MVLRITNDRIDAELDAVLAEVLAVCEKWPVV